MKENNTNTTPNNNYVVILAGGIGSRFWPISRKNKPKQFLDILNTGRTLIQATVDRFAKFIPLENIYVITGDRYKELVHEQLPELLAENILVEPARKNTAPAIAYISYKLQSLNPNANIICAPADHLVTDTEAFIQTSKKALDFTKHIPALLTLGILPTYPNTGYGYIQYEPFSVANNIFKVKTFTEKPDIELAKTFIASGDFLWNAGIFIWRAQTIVKAFENFAPEISEVFEAEKAYLNTVQEYEAIERSYAQCTNSSIDYTIMEKADNVYTMPSSFGWTDLGTWNSVYDVLEKDYLENAVIGDNVMIIDASKNIIDVPKNKLVVLQGLENFILVDTGDVLLIAQKDKEQDIKEYVAEVKRNKGDKLL